MNYHIESKYAWTTNSTLYNWVFGILLKLIRDSASLILGDYHYYKEHLSGAPVTFRNVEHLTVSFRTIPTVGWVLIYMETDRHWHNGRYPFPLYLNPNLNTNLHIFFLWASRSVLKFDRRNSVSLQEFLWCAEHCTLISSTAYVYSSTKTEINCEFASTPLKWRKA